MIQVWYHAGCYDGFGAAWAARRALGDAVKYVPVAYGKEHPPVAPEDEIYVVDFSFKRDVLLDLKSKVSFLRVLDHHKTAEEDLAGLPFCVFDMERSGAGITWDFFHVRHARPILIDLIEDRDLWRFKHPRSKDLHAFLLSQPFDFKTWDWINETLQSEPETILGRGKVLLEASEQLVDKLCAKSWVGDLLGHKVAFVNTASHWSEVGHALLEKHPDAQFAASFTVFQDHVMWSLRGRGDFDVSEVAKKFGGGGHKSAAGFRVNDVFPRSFR